MKPQLEIKQRRATKVFQLLGNRVTAVTFRTSAGSAPVPRQARRWQEAAAAPRKFRISASASTLPSIVEVGGEQQRLPRRDLVQRAGQIEHALRLRRVADQDDIEPVGRRAARRDRIGRPLEPHRLISQRRQHLLVMHSSCSRSLSTISTVSPRPSGSVAGPMPRCRRWLQRGARPRSGCRSPGLLCTFIAPSWSRTISCTVARPSPVPARRVVKNGSNNRRATPSSKPRPPSMTARHT